MRRLAAFVLLLVPTLAAADAKPSQEELQKLLSDTDVIARTVSQIRGLPVKKRIERDILSQDAIRKRLVDRLAVESTPAEIAGEEAALKRLGLLPRDMDYKQEMLDLLTEQIAGFYDATVKELYIADWIQPSLQRMVMAHEIDHALQDQKFDLDKFTKIDKENGDALIARQALVEGDGVALMIEFMLRDMGQKTDPWADDTLVNTMSAATGLASAPEFDKAPLVLKETLLFPYKEGLRLIASSRRTHPWSDVDAMYARPPASSEQVMHPDKYRANEKPIAVKSAPLASLRNQKPKYVNVLGEIMFRVIFQQHGIAKDRAERAAAGWGGDRFVLVDSASGPVGIDLSAWDAEADALEAAEALVEALPSLAGGEPESPAEKGPTYATARGKDGTVSLVERKGTRVLLLVGVPADLVDKLRAEVWNKWTTRAA